VFHPAYLAYSCSIRFVPADDAVADFAHSSGKNSVPDAIACCTGDSLICAM
jgi:hypothetical protein